MRIATLVRGLARLSWLACAAPALAAPGEVWTVAPSGADFTQIQPAVDAAAEGDLILVKPGSYAPFTIVDRSLTVVAESPDTVQVLGTVQISGLSSGRRVALIDLSAVGSPGRALRLADNLGSVRVQGGTWTGAAIAASQPISDALHVTACADVALVRCAIQGGAGLAGFWHTGGSGVFARESSVSVHHATLRGGKGSSNTSTTGADGGHGGSGMRLEGGFLYLCSATLEGGSGGHGGPSDLFFDGGDGGSGGPGLALNGAPLQGLSVPAHAELLSLEASGGVGGAGGVDTGFGAAGQPGAPGQPISVLGNADTHALAGPPRRLITDGLWRPGTAETLTFLGQPGDRVYLVSSPTTDFTWKPAQQGVLLLGGLPALKYLGELDATGELTRTVLPAGPPASIDGQVRHLQAWMAAPGGASVLTAPTTTALIQPWF